MLEGHCSRDQNERWRGNVDKVIYGRECVTCSYAAWPRHEYLMPG